MKSTAADESIDRSRSQDIMQNSLTDTETDSSRFEKVFSIAAHTAVCSPVRRHSCDSASGGGKTAQPVQLGRRAQRMLLSAQQSTLSEHTDAALTLHGSDLQFSHLLVPASSLHSLSGA